MNKPHVVHRYWVVEERTGIRRLTSQHLSAEEAARRYPGAEAEPTTRERRWLSAGAPPSSGTGLARAG